MERASLLRAVTDRLGNQQVIWAGLRGEDIESLSDLPQLSASYSIIGAYSRRLSIEGMAFEDLTGRRVDLERWDIDDHRHTEEVVEFRRAILRTLSQPSALLPYRPSRFLSAIWFARRDRCLNLGLFGAHQFAFEHKPWVETAVSFLGIPTIPWVYIADEEQLRATEMFDKGSLVLRLSRTSGGQGFLRIDTPADVSRLWPKAEEAFVSVAPYLRDVLPINVGATVWHDGVTVHYPSVQLIGLPNCVTREFGYCGNDFGLARELDLETIDEIESFTMKIGEWLRTKGYLGTFGVDYLLGADGTLRFTEVNPRFQGSTFASGRLAVETGRACLPLEHIAAMLDFPKPTCPPLRDRVQEARPLAQVIIHWTGPRAIRIDPAPLHEQLLVRDASSDVSTRLGLLTDPGGVVTRVTFRNAVTTNGFDLVEPYSSAVDAWTRVMSDGGAAVGGRE
jgi:hypothetical protein